LREKIIRWQTHVRMLFLAETVLWKYRAQLPGFELPKELITQQRQFDDRFALTLEGMAGRLEGQPASSYPALEDSVAKVGSTEGYAKTTEQTLSERDATLLSLRSRIQSLTTPLTQEI
jgi:multidrug resistance protein MdtO